MKQAPYSWEDASYLTRRSLGVPSDSWRHVGNDNLSTVILLLLLITGAVILAFFFPGYLSIYSKIDHRLSCVVS